MDRPTCRNAREIVQAPLGSWQGTTLIVVAKRWGKIVVPEQWGEQGPRIDVDLAQMEDGAVAAVRGLLAGTLEAATRRTAGLSRRRTAVSLGPRNAADHHAGGDFEHCEPKAHCPGCRRDFSPSAGRRLAGPPPPAVTVDGGRILTRHTSRSAPLCSAATSASSSTWPTAPAHPTATRVGQKIATLEKLPKKPRKAKRVLHF
jgi:hypothetical protein